MPVEHARIDTELERLRHFAAKGPGAKRMGLTEQVRLTVLDGWLAEFDAIIEDRRLHRLDSHRPGSIREKSE